MSELRELYKTLSQRKRPEDVAELVLQILKGDLTKKEKSTLNMAAKRSLKKALYGYTSMAQEFASAIGAEKQMKKTIELFKLVPMDESDANHAPDIQAFINAVAPVIHKSVGANNFVGDRLNKLQRKELGLDLSKRAYNKRWRLLKRLEVKLMKYEHELKKVEFQKIAKHGIVHHLSYEEFCKDTNTACFIAYYNARCNLRSVFTNGSQAKPYDEIAEMLFKRCDRNEANWLAMSYIYTGQKVLKRLSDHEKGELLGTWTTILGEIAQLLDNVWKASKINRKTMIVQRGNDSSTWNHTAGAWNKARDQWMNLIYAMGLDDILDELCFGKVMRLMAADVAYWHRESGGGLDPNTEVWNELPLPWEVFNGTKFCNKELVAHYCVEAGIHPEKSGWIAPRAHRVAKFTPTPELVHGVEVSNPFLANVLKKHKYYSGKSIKPFYPNYN